MLASMSGVQLEKWRLFYELDPDDGERNDWGLAHVVQAIIGNGKTLDHFALPFGDTPEKVQPVQSLAQQELLLDSWIITNNLIEEANAKKGAR